MDLTHNPHLRDIDHALSAEVNASQRQRVALPPFDSLNDGDIVTLRATVKRSTTFPHLCDFELAYYYEDGAQIDVACSATLDADDYRQCAIEVVQYTPNSLGVTS